MGMVSESKSPPGEPSEPVELRMRMHDPRVIDARGRLIDADALPESELAGAVEVLDAMFRWTRAEARVRAASERYMRLSATDMKAVRFLIVAANGAEPVERPGRGRVVGTWPRADVPRETPIMDLVVERRI